MDDSAEEKLSKMDKALEEKNHQIEKLMKKNEELQELMRDFIASSRINDDRSPFSLLAEDTFVTELQRRKSVRLGVLEFPPPSSRRSSTTHDSHFHIPGESSSNMKRMSTSIPEDKFTFPHEEKEYPHSHSYDSNEDRREEEDDDEEEQEDEDEEQKTTSKTEEISDTSMRMTGLPSSDELLQQPSVKVCFPKNEVEKIQEAVKIDLKPKTTFWEFLKLKRIFDAASHHQNLTLPSIFSRIRR